MSFLIDVFYETNIIDILNLILLQLISALGITSSSKCKFILSPCIHNIFYKPYWILCAITTQLVTYERAKQIWLFKILSSIIKFKIIKIYIEIWIVRSTSNYSDIAHCVNHTAHKLNPNSFSCIKYIYIYIWCVYILYMQLYLVVFLALHVMSKPNR